MGAGGQRDCAQCPAALYPGGWRREECSRWGLKEPPLEQSPQHGRCISSFLSSYLPAPYTASLNKFAYFYAMSSRHQKEQAAPSPSSLPFPAPPSTGPLASSKLPDSSVEESGARDFQKSPAHTRTHPSPSLCWAGPTLDVLSCRLTGGPGASFITGVPTRTVYFARNWKPDSN